MGVKTSVLAVFWVFADKTKKGKTRNGKPASQPKWALDRLLREGEWLQTCVELQSRV